MKAVKKQYINNIFLAGLLALYIGLFLAADSKWIRGTSLILLISALILKNKYHLKIIFLTVLIFDIIMIYYSIREIPIWGARVAGVCIGTDTVWGRDKGYVDSLIFTVAHDKKCIVEEGGWYNKYIGVVCDNIYMVDEIGCKMLYGDTSLINDFEEVGWMHINNNFNLLSDEANARFEEGEPVYLYINPNRLSETDTIMIWNDTKGNIYIQAYDRSNQE